MKKSISSYDGRRHVLLEYRSSRLETIMPPFNEMDMM